MTTLRAELEHFINTLMLGLVFLRHDSKIPVATSWQDSPIVNAEEAVSFWSHGSNIGINHAASGTAILDIDNLKLSRLAFGSVDVDALIAEPGPKIQGAKGLKPLYLLPEGIGLTRKVLTWHEPGAPKTTTVFELRAGKVQDVLPPSIHPDTGKPYLWVPARPEKREEIPELPGSLLALWQNWGVLKPVLDKAQPWHTVPPPSLPAAENGGVIAAFNEAESLHDLLQQHGYQRKTADRYLSPHSSTGVPGVILVSVKGGERVLGYHASDPLQGELGHDTFSAWTVLEHNGNIKEAVKAAAMRLGMAYGGAKKKTPSAPTAAERPPYAPENSDQVPWNARLPLPALYPPVPPLPPELIPTPLRPWLSDIAERASLPLEFVSCPALVALSAVIGRKVGIRPKRLDDWLVVSNLWGGIVGKPGVMKSAAISEPTKPLRDLIKRAQERYEEASQRAEAERVRLELEIAVLKEEEKRAAKKRYKSE